jgi:fermentation-respiration switch protein FrsA (DUF1100 family)
MRARWLILLALGVVLAGVAVAVGACTTVRVDEGDVFLPKPSITPASFAEADSVGHGVRFEEITFASADSVAPDGTVLGDSLRLNGWLLTRPDARGTVLFFGGNGFYLVQARGYVQALTRLPVNILFWDYRGYGKSGGQPSVSGFKRDALAAYDWLVQTRGVRPNQVVLHGHSLGSFMALHVENERETAGVVLENPATNVDGWVKALTPWIARLFVNIEVDERLRGEDNLDRARRMTAPLLVVGGTKDQVTPPDMARALHEAATAPSKDLLLLDGGGHNGLYARPAYDAAYRALLDRALPAAPEATRAPAASPNAGDGGA